MATMMDNIRYFFLSLAPVGRDGLGRLAKEGVVACVALVVGSAGFPRGGTGTGGLAFAGTGGDIGPVVGLEITGAGAAGFLGTGR